MKKQNEEKNSTVSQSIRKKPNKKIIALACSGAAVLVALIIVLSVVLTAGGQSYFTPPESTLPIKDKYALTRYDYEEAQSVQATLRADVLNVTERGLPRSSTSILTDDFSLVYNTDSKELSAVYGTASAGTNKKVSSVTFTKYPNPVSSIKAADFADAAEAAGKSQEQYFAYYKYMLMTQGQHLAHEASRRSAASYRAEGDNTPRGAESLSGWLKKHPAADAQYGEVIGENNAVKKRIILDPIYRGQHTTGLYLPAGEVATIKVTGLKPGERINVLLGEQNTLAWRGGIRKEAEAEISSVTGGINSVTFVDSTSDMFFKKADILTANGSFYTYNATYDGADFLQSQWKRQNWRTPWLSASFTFDKNGEYEIGFAFGGLINISPQNCYSNADITITGAVETPHYILGVTTPEYFDTYLRDAPGVIAVLDTENGQLIGPADEAGKNLYYRWNAVNSLRQIKTEEIDKLAMLWHSFFSVNESFTGGIYNRYNKVMFDWHVPAGAAVALGGHTYACPTEWFNGAMSYRGLLAGGTWGVLHEVGHNHGAAYGSIWGFGAGRDGEVRNNALNLLSYIISCDIGTTVRNKTGDTEHGEYANPYNVLAETLTFKNKEGDYDDGTYGYFQCLGMYANLMHSFGADKYYELLYTYGEEPNYVTRREGDSKGIYKRADFAYRCALTYGMNFIKYFNTFYCANIPEDYFTAEQLSYMKELPVYEPVSNFYAGGIDGVKTAGDYLVTYGSDITFDLLTTTVSSLDDGDKKGFEIISVGNPDHGSIKDIGGGKYVYSFNKEYTGALDDFRFRIKMNDGVIHEFRITLRISYHGASVESYTNITVDPKATAEGKLDNAMMQTETLESERSDISNPVYSYNSPSGVNEVKVLEYYYKAPETGEYELSLRGDDYAYAYFGKDFESIEKVLTLPAYSGGYSENLKYSVSLVKDEFYAVRLFNLNTGGKGGVALGIRAAGETSFKDIPASAAYHPELNLEREIETYVFEAQYLISKKDSVKLANTGTDKSEWSVVEAPDGDHIHEGRYKTETMVDEKTGETTEFITDKWDWLIDGQTGTLFHTAYTGHGVRPPTETAPDVFIIDTASEQTFNYFTISSRNTANAMITKYRLSVSKDNVTYETVSEGDSLPYKKGSVTLTFPQVSGRYWKLEVMATTGKNFTIISELDTGIQSSTQRILPSSSGLLYTTDGWKNSNSIDDLPNGYIVAENRNEKAVIRFIGESITLYAATGEGYGSADVYIDGKKHSTVHLDSEIREARKLVVNAENLGNKEHTLEIITTSADKVMLNVIGIPYTASLINAPNIYAERALTISLVVFVLLFAALAALIAVLVFVPKFRNMVFGNKYMEKLDNRPKKSKEKAVKSEAPEAAPEPAVKRSAKKTEPPVEEKAVKKPAPAKTPAKTPAKAPVKKTNEKKGGKK